jgi:hypothetical protein
MAPADLTLPTVHLNGTSRTMLAEGYGNAYRKLQEAILAFGAIKHNARDYVQGPGAWPQAAEQHVQMREHLNAVQKYLVAHLIHLGE